MLLCRNSIIWYIGDNAEMGFSKNWLLLLPRSGGDFAVIPGAEAGVVAKSGISGGEMESLTVSNEKID